MDEDTQAFALVRICIFLVGLFVIWLVNFEFLIISIIWFTFNFVLALFAINDEWDEWNE